MATVPWRYVDAARLRARGFERSFFFVDSPSVQGLGFPPARRFLSRDALLMDPGLPGTDKSAGFSGFAEGDFV